MASVMQDFVESSNLFGSNAPFVEELYERYLTDPASVSPEWRAQFDAWQQGSGGADIPHSRVIAAFEQLARNPLANATGSTARAAVGDKGLKVLQYIRAHRVMGSRHSQLDPLKRLERMPVPELELDFYGLGEADMDTEFSPGSWQGAKGPMKLRHRGRGEEDLLRHCRARVHVRLLDRAEALDPAALRGDAVHAQHGRRAEALDPRAPHRIGDAGALPAHALRGTEALLGRGRREHDPDARHDHRELRRRGREGGRDRHGPPRAARCTSRLRSIRRTSRS